jgi:tRNA1Val (adenine37-N6)-methyltransferase
MSEVYFKFKHFKVYHHKSSMKVGTEAVLLPCLTDFANTRHILEIGSGSGVISLLCAQLSKANILAIDIHKDSVKQAHDNFSLSPWKDRLTVKNIALQDFALKSKQRFDLIISNPPFFIDSMKSPYENRNLARHNETLSHLDLLSSAHSLLKPNGRISLILPLIEGEKMIKKASVMEFYLKSRVNIKPKPTKAPNRIIIELSLIEEESKQSELIIREENNEYTRAYRELTKDFYIAL